jgi:hypothetical protein
VPGSDKPVKYSDFINGFVPKSDFTRAQQRIAAEKTQLQQQLQAQEQRFTQAAQQILARLGQGGQAGNAQADPNSIEGMLAQLESAPYVDGPTAAKLMRGMVQQNVLPLAQALQQRDQALRILFQRLQQLDGTVGSLANRTGNEDFTGKIARVRGDLQLPDDPQVNELLQDIYLSHEGNDLDQEFPNMVKTRFDALRQVVRAMDRQEAETARANRIGLPGRGGAASPGRPLRRGFQTPQQIADDLWPGGQPET